jgi:7-carboxy-7-deazaguanine synthase
MTDRERSARPWPGSLADVRAGAGGELLELKPPAPHTKRFPVIEIFGPTVQGEGFLAGLPTHFVRFGGCDYRCSWCDSMYAVDPAEVREHAERLTAAEIAGRLDMLPAGPSWVTFSGGNPALHRLGHLVETLQGLGYLVSVETQGSIWRDWLKTVDHLTVSPKPPSSGMAYGKHTEQTGAFLHLASQMPMQNRSLKIVVFDEQDLAWARDVFLDQLESIHVWHKYLSVGTDLYKPSGMIGSEQEVAEYERQRDLFAITDRYRWLCERVAADEAFAHVRVMPQLHVLAWGHARGV